MIKKVRLASITGVLICLSITVQANPLLTQTIISDINGEIADATAACDFKEVTKRYFDGTKFYSYEMVNGVESVVEQSFDEVIPAIKELMSSCSITLEGEKTVSEAITISPSGQQADFIFEVIQSLRSSDGQLFKSHNKGKIVYGFHQGKIVILESHYKVLAFEEME